MGDKFNDTALYYRCADGGEFKLLPIKPITEAEISVTQYELLKGTDISLLSYDINESAIIENSDELFKAIMAMEQHYQDIKDLHIICEMAKRYIYWLKKQGEQNE